MDWRDRDYRPLRNRARPMRFTAKKRVVAPFFQLRTLSNEITWSNLPIGLSVYRFIGLSIYRFIGIPARFYRLWGTVASSVVVT